jgi:hypothetical protein
MASDDTHHQLEAGLIGSNNNEKKLILQAAVSKPSKQQHANILRRKMLAFWVIVASPLICFLTATLLTPLFWPGSLVQPEDGAIAPENVGIASVDSTVTALEEAVVALGNAHMEDEESNAIVVLRRQDNETSVNTPPGSTSTTAGKDLLSTGHWLSLFF